MKFYLEIFLLAALCVLTLAQETDEWLITAANWSAPLDPLNENGTYEGPLGRPGIRITGGKLAQLGDIPYQVSLQILRNGAYHFCGGTLLLSNWVLTTAYCIKGATAIRIRVATTVYNSGVEFSGFSIRVHPGYNPTNLNDNIGLISFAGITSGAGTINIAESSLQFSSVRASGWGTMSDGKMSTYLRYADFLIYDQYKCARYYAPGVINSDTLCTVSPIDESACGADIGGPLVDNVSKKLVGIISFISSRGCWNGVPNGHVKVANYRTWLRGMIGTQWL